MWKKLETFFNNLDQKHTAERYYEICEQLGKEVDPEKIPPEWGDFPESVQQAVNIYHSLGDRIAADIGFLGKDYTLLPTLLEIEEVSDLDFTIEIILWLETRTVNKSNEEMKKAHEKIKKQSKASKGPVKGVPKA